MNLVSTHRCQVIPMITCAGNELIQADGRTIVSVLVNRPGKPRPPAGAGTFLNGSCMGCMGQGTGLQAVAGKGFSLVFNWRRGSYNFQGFKVREKRVLLGGARIPKWMFDWLKENQEGSLGRMVEKAVAHFYGLSAPE